MATSVLVKTIYFCPYKCPPESGSLVNQECNIPDSL